MEFLGDNDTMMFLGGFQISLLFSILSHFFEGDFWYFICFCSEGIVFVQHKFLQCGGYTLGTIN
jgi:hypothetical protein